VLFKLLQSVADVYKIMGGLIPLIPFGLIPFDFQIITQAYFLEVLLIPLNFGQNQVDQAFSKQFAMEFGQTLSCCSFSGDLNTISFVTFNALRTLAIDSSLHRFESKP